MTDGLDRLYALSEAFRAFAEVTTDSTKLLETIAQQMTLLVGDSCVIFVATDDGGFQPAAVDACEPHIVEMLRVAAARIRADARHPGAGVAPRVAQSGQGVFIPEATPEEIAARIHPAFSEAVLAAGVWGCISVPLDVHGRRLGAVTLCRCRRDRPPYSEDDRVFARTISDHAALALANAQLFESLQHELRERKRAEDEAKTYVALIENSTEFIAMAALDGRVRFVNTAGRALLGLPADLEVGTLSLADFHTEAGLKRGPLLEQKGAWQGEGVLRHFKTNQLIPTQISSFLVRDTDGQAIGFATVQHDMRETKRLESELRQAQKMEALGRLAGGVAHDFNNLLTVILSYCAILAKSVPAESRTARDIAQIDRAGTRAAQLTHQLLAFSRQQVLEPKPLDLDDTVRGMDGLIRRLIGEDIQLRIVANHGLGHVMVDAGQIEQVVMNLVVNARDAMREGGVLALETSRIELGPRVGSELGLPPGAYVTLAVSDTGTGIDPKALPNLFEPFFTTKERGKGTGLGLSTAMGIVKQSGGHITVTSELGRGSTFRVYLQATTSAVAPSVVSPSRTLTLRGNERILVVEDEQEVRVLIRDVLREAGYEVIEASDGEQALEVCTRIDGKVDLLLTDVIMPNMSGRQLAEHVRARHADARILYMSGYTDDKLGPKGVLDPGVQLIQKPLTPEILLRRVRDALNS